MYCQCGCGGVTAVAARTHSMYGDVKGQHRRFIRGHHRRLVPRDADDYIYVVAPSHPRASYGRVPQHILVAEKAVGRFLPPGAEVHHVDGNKQNNAGRNLVVCPSHAYHRLLHVRASVVRAGGDPNTQRLCRGCNQLLTFDKFHRSAKYQSGIQNRCKSCARAYQQLRRSA